MAAFESRTPTPVGWPPGSAPVYPSRSHADNGHRMSPHTNHPWQSSPFSSTSNSQGVREASWFNALERRAVVFRSEPWVRTGLLMAGLLVVYGSWQGLRWGPLADRESIADGFFYD